MSRLQVFIGGTCGSSATRHLDRTSNLTTSFAIVRDNVGILIDNGTGIINCAPFLQTAGIESLIMLQTHLHLDHTEGLPLNSLLFQKTIPIEGIWAPKNTESNKDFSYVWETMFDKTFWRIRPEDFAIEHPPFHTIKGMRHTLADYEETNFITTMTLNHPGSSQAYRIAHPLGDIVIATDHEPGNPDIDAAYTAFVSGAEVLVADIQYRLDEYLGDAGIRGGPKMSRKGWGHATPASLFGCVRKCPKQPERILVTHHDPARTGYDLAHFGEHIEDAAQIFGITSRVELAEDKQLIHL